MAAGSTYTPIATTTAGGASAVITFGSIPSTYTDLIIVCNVLAMTVGGLNLTYNNDTSSIYSNTEIYGDGSDDLSARTSGYNYMRVGYTNSSNPINAIIHVQNYANTSTFKTLLNRWNSSLYVFATVGLWRSTAAINRLDLTAVANIPSGSTFTLYGIEAA